MNRTGEKHESVDWARFEDCPICGARAGAQCFGSNGSRKRIPDAARPYTLDGIREKFAELEAGLEEARKKMHALRAKILKQQRQIDLLLGEVE